MGCQCIQPHGISYRHSELNRSQLYLNALPLINSKRLRLLDNRRAVDQFCGLERRVTRGGRDSVDHRPNASDDLCNAIAGLASVVSFGRRRHGEVRVGIAPFGGRVEWIWPRREPGSGLRAGPHQTARASRYWKRWDPEQKRFL